MNESKVREHHRKRKRYGLLSPAIAIVAYLGVPLIDSTIVGVVYMAVMLALSLYCYYLHYQHNTEFCRLMNHSE